MIKACISICLFFICILSHLSIYADQQTNISANLNSEAVFYDVHVWPDSKCDICHISSNPDTETADLISDDLSLLCESCHTGTTTVLSSPYAGIAPLRIDNHPIKFTPLDFDPDKINHNIVREGINFYVSGYAGKVPLYGDTRESAVVECSSCHDPHGKSGMPYLQRSNIPEEDFCIICHISIQY